MASIPKIKLNPQGALDRHLDTAANAAKDRFSRAASIVERRPSGLADDVVVKAEVEKDGSSPAAHSSSPDTPHAGFSLAQCVPGAVVRVPLHLLDLNPVGPRQIYKSEEIDKIAQTLPDAQDDAAHGFVKNGRITLIDGGTRYRSAKVSGVGFLDVKIEIAPETELDLYLRARQYNDQRSQPTVIDHSLSLLRLLEGGSVASARELAEKVPDVNGRGKMPESQVSTYLRIARMPRIVLERMSESPVTSQLTVLYAVSDIFEKDVQASSEQIDLAMQIIEEIKQKDLSKKQVQDLVKSRLSKERQHRERSVQQSIAYGSCKGHIKLFGKRGQLDLSLKGLSEEDLPLLQNELQALIEKFATERQKTA